MADALSIKSSGCPRVNIPSLQKNRRKNYLASW